MKNTNKLTIAAIILIYSMSAMACWHFYDKGYKAGYDKCVKDNYFTIIPESETK